MTTTLPAVSYTAKPADLDGKCPYRLVDPAPHHYRVQGTRFYARHPWEGAYMWPFNAFADTAEDAQALAQYALGEGYKGVSIMAPQCNGTH